VEKWLILPRPALGEVVELERVALGLELGGEGGVAGGGGDLDGGVELGFGLSGAAFALVAAGKEDAELEGFGVLLDSLFKSIFKRECVFFEGVKIELVKTLVNTGTIAWRRVSKRFFVIRFCLCVIDETLLV